MMHVLVFALVRDSSGLGVVFSGETIILGLVLLRLFLQDVCKGVEVNEESSCGR